MQARCGSPALLGSGAAAELRGERSGDPQMAAGWHLPEFQKPPPKKPEGSHCDASTFASQKRFWDARSRRAAAASAVDVMLQAHSFATDMWALGVILCP